MGISLASLLQCSNLKPLKPETKILQSSKIAVEDVAEKATILHCFNHLGVIYQTVG
jgi:hypothetical protein